MTPGLGPFTTAFDGALVGILREYSTIINEHGNELVIAILLRSTIPPELHEPSKFLRVREFNFELVYLQSRKGEERTLNSIKSNANEYPYLLWLR